MKIFGIGTDIVNIKRMEKSLKNMVLNLKEKFFHITKLFIVKIKKIQLHFMRKDLLLKKLLPKL